MRVDCIRVTHPYATLVPILLSELPFGLHVLGLPLAFILSQDQTLHSIILKLPSPPFTVSSSTPPTPVPPFQASPRRLCHLSLISSLLLSLVPTSRPTPFPFFKNRLAVNLHRSTAGPLSISIYSKNVLKTYPSGHLALHDPT